jgi:hypothetical protein
MQLYRYEERHPYPVLNSFPTVGQILSNMNKTDFLLYLFVMVISFLGTVALTRKCVTMMRKIKILHYNMHFINLCALIAVTSCSY